MDPIKSMRFVSGAQTLGDCLAEKECVPLSHTHDYDDGDDDDDDDVRTSGRL